MESIHTNYINAQNDPTWNERLSRERREKVELKNCLANNYSVKTFDIC
jgi:hypothetical protein